MIMKPDPAFDGHLERPLTHMSMIERLAYADEMIRVRHWARQAAGRPITEADQDSETISLHARWSYTADQTA